MPDTAVLSIDILNDLETTSALKTLLTSQGDAIFDIAGEVAAFEHQSVSAAASANASASLTLNANKTWTVPGVGTGISFTLAASATGTITIGAASKTFAVTAEIDADDTMNIVASPPTATTVYVNIDLAFSMQGTAAAGGNINGIGIAGAVSDGHTATLTFSQPVEGGINTFDAIKRAFSQIVFPLDPAGILNMRTGALSRAVFDGTFNAAVNVTYGLGDHTFAAPTLTNAVNSAQNVVSLTPPSLEIDAGVSGSVTYTHTDHFALVVDKSTATVATVYLVRMLKNDVGLTTGITAGITATNVSIKVDQAGLTGLVHQVTGSTTLASAITSAASTPVNNLTDSLNARLASWATDVSGEIGLAASLDRQTNRATLFVFDADLAAPALATASWKALVAGDLVQALKAGGLTLHPGSGVSESLKRSATISFQFFNLFKFTSTSVFFSNASAELGPDGTIRLLAAIGQETDTNTQKALATMRIYFIVSASSNASGNVTQTNADLRFELIEANRPGAGATYEETLTLLPQGNDIKAAQGVIGAFLGGGKTRRFVLIYNIKSTAYARLTASFFSGNKPAQLPQTADRANWTVFRDASVKLNVAPATVANLTFDNWTLYNRAENGIDPSDPPNRRQVGARNNGLTTLPGNGQQLQAAFFLDGSQGFMNLCEDLSILAGNAGSPTSTDSYDDLLELLTSIIKGDIPSGYLVPTAGALVQQCCVTGTRLETNIDKACDNSALTCTITVS